MGIDDYEQMNAQRDYEEEKCTCADKDCDMCLDEECYCGTHPQSCTTCGVFRGCACDWIYESHKESLLARD